MRTTDLLGFVACAALCLAPACQSGPEDTAGDAPAVGDAPATGFTADAPGVPDSLSEAPAPEVGAAAVVAELEARGGTDVIGDVTLTPGEAGTTVSVEIHGANSGLPYVAEVVAGSCASLGSVIAELGEIVAGEEGDGEFHAVVEASLLAPERADRAVRVRGAGDPNAIVACGDLGPGAISATGR